MRAQIDGTIRTALGATTVNPDLLTYAKKLQYGGYLRREETNSVITKLAGAGVSIKEIMRRTGYSRQLLRQVTRGRQTDILRVRQSSLEGWFIYLDEQWTGGCRNASELWRHLKAKGFRGCLGVVSEWARRRRHAERASDRHLHKVPSARTIARLMTIARDHLSKTNTVMIAAIETGAPTLAKACGLIDGFHSMIRKKAADDLDPWIARASKSLIASFPNGIIRDARPFAFCVLTTWHRHPDGSLRQSPSRQSKSRSWLPTPWL
jgi:transposase